MIINKVNDDGEEGKNKIISKLTNLIKCYKL